MDTGEPRDESPARARRRVRRSLARRHPPFTAAVLADARVACANRGEPVTDPTGWRLAVAATRLCGTTDAFLALVLYRAKARLQAFGVPVLPSLAHHLAIAVAGVSVGDLAVLEPGVYLPHGQVVIDGFVTIATGTAIRPWVTIGLKEGRVEGPVIGRNVRIGTGAKRIGPVRVGDGALIGANAVVVDDVAPRTRVAGVPARELARPDGNG